MSIRPAKASNQPRITKVATAQYNSIPVLAALAPPNWMANTFGLHARGWLRRR